MDAMTPPEVVVKPGYKTSEMATLLAYGALVAANNKFQLNIDSSVLMALGGAVVTYIAQRGWVKR